MVAAFATVADLVSRGRAVASEDVARAETALEDASAFLRGEIGWQVYPAATVTVTRHDWSQLVPLSGGPVRSVSAVSIDGTVLAATDYELIDGHVHLSRFADHVSVTYEIGYSAPPDELVAWTCVLAADTLSRADDPDDSGGARPASESLADWRVVYSKRQQDGDLPIPDRVLERLRSTYGQSVFVA